MPNKGGYRPYGWTGYSSGTARNVQLPQKMKCYRCGKNKDSVTNFSKKEQDRARDYIQRSGSPPSDLKCIACTGGQNTEMQCVICEQVMGLDMFAKTHRRNPENARCKRCMVEQTEWDPTEFENKKKADSDDSDDDDDQDYDSDDDTEYDRPSRPAKSEFISATSSTTGDDDVTSIMGSLSVNDTSSISTRSQPTSNFMSSDQFSSSKSGGVQLPTPSATSGDGEWQSVESRRRAPASSAESASSTAARASTPGSTPMKPSGFNPNAYGNPIQSNPGSRSTSGTPSKSSAWAKPKTVIYKSSKPDNDDEQEEAVPEVSAAPAWESDSDDDE